MRGSIAAKQRRSFFLAVPPLIAHLREIKDTDEISRLRAAAALGCSMFENLLHHIEAGKREVEIAAQLEFAARMAGIIPLKRG